ncbi:type II and III secretion system protein family protein [Erythrobacter sp. EC-HK427]|uniref:type II and III secretion system protein family protein n=1 Tax=Erythrobacter sp. EC-HK427 TaxID=2038396 RepID=UPI001F407BC8|nr:type II and III secretion system protein family protein [Erythrobacter sp. EC-HK427]
MTSRLMKTVMSAAVALAPLAMLPATQAQAQTIRPAQDLVLSIGRGELVTVPGNMADIFVADNTIADVQVRSERQLYVFGLAGGETTIYASNSAGDIIWSANIRVGSNIDSVDQMLSLAMPEANISVSTMGSNTVLLTGTVAAPEDAAEAERLVQAFVGEDANVISRLRMATPLQVMLRVRFAEVSRSLVRNIGMNLSTVDSTDGFRFGLGQGRSPFSQVTPGGAPVAVGGNLEGEGYNIVDQISPGSTLAAFGEFLGLDIGSALDLGERRGLVTTLSEPTLVALSGETAQFHAGGQFPIPLSQGLGTTTVQYRDFGVSLVYTPTVLSNGRISIRVRPEVSELSTQGAVVLNGFQIPALTIRSAETSIELGSGESFMIAGLMQNSSQSTVDQIPGVGDMPIIGNLFRSTEFRRGETELVIVVTPYLVQPVNDRDIRLPTDGYGVPGAAEQTLFGRETSNQPGERPMPRPANGGPNGPDLSLIDQTGTALAGGQQPQGAPAQSASASALPGFSFNNGE